MSKDDMAVVVFKVLSYSYACMKEGVDPSLHKARELAGVNDLYFDSVVGDLLARRLLSGELSRNPGEAAPARPLRITLGGVEYLDGSSFVAGARADAGLKFEEELGIAVEDTCEASSSKPERQGGLVWLGLDDGPP